jgi:hypothetical protein
MQKYNSICIRIKYKILKITDIINNNKRLKKNMAYYYLIKTR